MSVSLAVYIPPAPSSIQFRPYRQRIGDRTTLRHLLDRCISVLDDEVDECIVLCPADQETALNAELGSNAKVRVASTNAAGLAQALRAAALPRPSLRTILLLPENGIFPDCEASRELLNAHRSEGAMLTAPLDLPNGLLPIAIDVGILQQLEDYAHGISSSGVFWQILAGLRRLQAPAVLRPHWFQPHTISDQLREQLPEAVLITDHHSLRAASRVYEDFPGAIASGPTPACQFKTRLLCEPHDAPQRHHIRHSGTSCVLFSSLQPAFSGGEESLFHLIASLDQKRYRPVIWCVTPSLLTERLSGFGYDVITSDRPRELLTTANLNYFTDLLDLIRPAVIHVDGFVNPALMAAGRLKGISIVSHVRMLFDVHRERELAMADAIIAISRTVAAWLRRRNIRPDLVRTIYNGVDTSRFAPRPSARDGSCEEFGLNPNHPVVCLIGRITPQKQHHLLIEALPLLHRHVPGAQVLCIGDVFDQHYSWTLRQRAEELGVSRAIHWAGFRPDIETVYAASDALVLCTQMEPFGRCIIEAMAMGVPCVVPQLGGPAEIVTHRVDGLLYDPRNPNDLASALGELLTSRALHRTLSDAAQQRAEEFAVSHHAQQVQDLYDELQFRKLTGPPEPVFVRTAGPDAPFRGV